MDLISLKERARPATLAEVVGQPQAVDQLRILARAPRTCCIALHGKTGTGKTTAAMALANDLGCYSGTFDTAITVAGPDLSADKAREFFGPWDNGAKPSPFAFKASNGFHVLIIEEMEYIVSKAVLGTLKDALEGRINRLNWKLIVVATSNLDWNPAGDKARKELDAVLPRALRDRFRPQFAFDSGLHFAEAVQRDLLPRLWEDETCGAALPENWRRWGWDYASEEFSARRAVEDLEEAARMRVVDMLRRVGA